jgi:hypothetical protein
MTPQREKASPNSATPRPWKTSVTWDISGLTENRIFQDCQPGCKWKSDTFTICTFPPAIQNRENAKLIVQAVNLFDALESVAAAAEKLYVEVDNKGCKLGQALAALEQAKKNL